MKQQTDAYGIRQVTGKPSFLHCAKKSTSLFLRDFFCVYLCNYEFGCESIFLCYILLLTTHISTYFPHFSIHHIPYTFTTKNNSFLLYAKKIDPSYILPHLLAMFLHAFFVKILFNQLF